MSDPASDDPWLLDVDQAAKLCGLPTSTIRRAITRQGLPVVRIGRWVRIRPAALDAWLIEQTTPSHTVRR